MVTSGLYFHLLFLDVMIFGSRLAAYFLLSSIVCCTFFLDYNTANAQPVVNDPGLTVEVVFEGLNLPTSMAFLGADDILALEKDNGTVNRIVNGQISEVPSLDVPVASKGDRGMLGVAISGGKNNITQLPHVFLYYTESSTNKDGDDVSRGEEPLGNRVYKYDLDNGILKNGKLILELPADTPADVKPLHNGGKLLVGPDQNLYVVIGDLSSPKEQMTQAQNIQDGPPPDGTSVIYRVNQNGDPVKGNPFESLEGLDKYYAYGIRNSFGMDFDPLTGKLWDTENGPDHGDEINLVEPGFNSGSGHVYGMPSAGDNFDPEELVDFNGKGNYSDPEFVWDFPVGPTAIKFLDSDKYGKEYENDMFVGDINNGNIYHFELDDRRDELSLYDDLEDKVADDLNELDEITFGQGFGQIIDLTVGPDGYLYVLAINRFPEDNFGTIYRIVPVSDLISPT
jgi:glucose/arabinose dehydrogenase